MWAYLEITIFDLVFLTGVKHQWSSVRQPLYTEERELQKSIPGEFLMSLFNSVGAVQCSLQ